MVLKVGDAIPKGNFHYIPTNSDDPQQISASDIFDNQKCVVVGLPGAFTSVCSAKQLPQFIDQANALKEKGVTRIVCISVNDAWVMKVRLR